MRSNTAFLIKQKMRVNANDVESGQCNCNQMQMLRVFLTKFVNARECLFVNVCSANVTTMGVQRYLVNANATKNATACLQMRDTANACRFCNLPHL